MGSKNAAQDTKKDEKKKIKPNKDSDAAAENNNDRHKIGCGGGRKTIADPRFASVHSDPRFQKVSKQKSKVVIDSRFNRMFTDKNFGASAAPLDKRGKPKKHIAENSLRHYYRIDEEEERKEDDKEKKMIKDEDSSEEEEESQKEELGKLQSESSSESESEDDVDSTTDEDDEDQVENVPTVEDGTHRLAVVNMDWRHVRAVDLYVVLRSFLPKVGEILSVAVYPSEFGLLQMKEEELHGPVGLFDNEYEDDNDERDDNDGDEINTQKLRAYEKSRLRYYFAVVECNSVTTAEQLYKACDGVEFERSSNVLDLRFIPNSMEFKHPPRDVATEAPSSYEGLDFHTKALQHSNIPISWDEDEPQRVKTLKRKFTAEELADLELKEFLASDESESDEDGNDGAEEGVSNKKHNKWDKYLALIQSGEGSEENEDEGQDMEITFNTELEGLSKRLLEKRDKKSESIWETHLRKKREKKKARKMKSKYSSEDESSDADKEMREEPDDFFVEERAIEKGKKDTLDKSNKEGKQLQDTDKESEASRAELELLLADDNGADIGVKGYNLKHNKAKGKRGKEALVESKIPTIDYNDPRFSAMFNSPLFALDPTDPQFKRSAAYARQVAQKQHKGGQQELAGEYKKQRIKSHLSDKPDVDKSEHMTSDKLPSKKEKHEISLLVKSLKMKSKQLQLPSKGKTKKDGKLQRKGIEEMEKPELSTWIQSAKKLCKNEKSSVSEYLNVAYKAEE